MGFRTWYGFKRDTHTTILDSRITNQAGYVNTGGLLRPDINFSGALMFDVRYWGFFGNETRLTWHRYSPHTEALWKRKEKNCTCCRPCFMTIVYPLSLGLLIPRFLWHQWCFLIFSPCEGFAARLSHWVKFSWVAGTANRRSYIFGEICNEWLSSLPNICKHGRGVTEWALLFSFFFSLSHSSFCLSFLALPVSVKYKSLHSVQG